MEYKPLRTIKSFSKRSGRITASQAQALQDLSSQYCMLYSENIIDHSAYYEKSQPFVIEIGFGNGESLLTMAQKNSHVNYLGIEVYTAGIGSCLIGIEKFGLKNLMLIEHDAVEVLKNMIKDNSVSGFQIFFPDPWHKKRHHKRRLIQPEFVALLTNKLQQNGFIHCATDWEHYAEQMLSVLSKNSNIKNMHEHYAPRPDSRPLTKFERRGQKLAHQVWDILFEKV